MSIEDSQLHNEPELPPEDDVVTIQRPWIVAVVAGVVGLIVGGAAGFALALTAYNQGVGDAMTAVENALAESQAAQVAQAPQAGAPTATPPPPQLENVSVDDDPALGPPDAPVVIVEFSDFR